MKNDFIRNKNFKNQPKKAVKKTFSFYALVFALLFMFIGSILGSIAFLRTSSSESSTNIAYADSVSDFWVYEGSDLFYPVQRFNRSGSQVSSVFGSIVTSNFIGSNPTVSYPSLPYFVSMGITLKKGYSLNYIGNYYVSNVPYITFNWLGSTLSSQTFNQTLRTYINNSNNLTLISTSQTSYGHFLGGYSTSDLNTNLPNQTHYGSDTIIKSRYTFGFDNISSSNDYFYGDIYTTTTYGFNCNVYSVEIYSSLPNVVNTYDNATVVSFSNFIKYTDINGATFLIEIPITTVQGSYSNNYYNFPAIGSWKFEPRTYYTQGGVVGEIDQQLKQQASIITQRYEDQIQAMKIQYENQLENAVATARQQGYNEGISNNNTTFLSLFGALFDAPIQAVSGLLNFDVLGFNLWNFFTAVITVGIVIFAVRFFL